MSPTANLVFPETIIEARDKFLSSLRHYTFLGLFVTPVSLSLTNTSSYLFTEHFLYARDYIKCFPIQYLRFINPHRISMRELLSSPHFTDEKTGA